MTVRRVMGIETEYGISVPGDPAANPMILSRPGRQRLRAGPGRAVPAAPRGTTPTRRRCGTRAGSRSAGRGRPEPADRRGGPDPGQRRAHQRRPALRRPRPPGVLLARGHQPARGGGLGPGRRAIMPRRSAGSRTARACRASTSTRTTPTARAQSYGTHENYLMRRETPFTDIVRHLVPFFVVRQVITGSGRVGIGHGLAHAGLPAEPAQPTSSRSRWASRRP